MVLLSFFSFLDRKDLFKGFILISLLLFSLFPTVILFHLIPSSDVSDDEVRKKEYFVVEMLSARDSCFDDLLFCLMSLNLNLHFRYSLLFETYLTRRCLPDDKLPWNQQKVQETSWFQLHLLQTQDRE